MKLQNKIFYIGLILAIISLEGMAQNKSEMLVPYRKGNLWGYADYDLSRFVIAPRYLRASIFKDGSAVAEKKKGVFVEINYYGAEQGPSTLAAFTEKEADAQGIGFDDLVTYRAEYGDENDWRRWSKENEKAGFRDNKKIFVPFVYEDISYGCEYFGIVKGSNQKWGVVNLKDTIVDFDYDQITVEPEKGYFKVKKNGKYGIHNLGYYSFYGTHLKPAADKDAVTVLYVGFNDQRVVDIGGAWVAVVKKGNLFGLDKSYELAPCKYTRIVYVHNKLFRVVYKGKTGYVNADGKEFFQDQ